MKCGDLQTQMYLPEIHRRSVNRTKRETDFSYSKPQGNTKLLLSTVNYQTAIFTGSTIEITGQKTWSNFRVEGKIPQIWHPETGKTDKASYSIANGVTTVNLNLAPEDAVFVVFKDKATVLSSVLPSPKETALTELKGEWMVSFQKDRGAPASITMDELSSWANNKDAGIKYFSGTATYAKTISAPAEWLKKERNCGWTWVM